MMAAIRCTLIVLCMLELTGCEAGSWARPDTTSAQRSQDVSECGKSAAAHTPSPFISKEWGIARSQCMRDRGYRGT
jgi:hypothetical protein